MLSVQSLEGDRFSGRQGGDRAHPSAHVAVNRSATQPAVLLGARNEATARKTS